MVMVTELNSATALHRAPHVYRGRTVATLIRRVWGRDAFFHQDRGLPDGYGQIFRRLPNTGNGWSATSLSGRVRLDDGK